MSAPIEWVPINIRVNRELWEQVKEAAHAERLSARAFLERALRQEVEATLGDSASTSKEQASA